MRDLNEQKLINRARILEEKRKNASVKDDDLPFYLRIQKDTEREKKVESMQKTTFFGVIMHRDELKHLKEQKNDLFIEFWLDFLKGECQSIDDFFYSNGRCDNEDPKELSIDFFRRHNDHFKFKLKNRFKKTGGGK